MLVQCLRQYHCVLGDLDLFLLRGDHLVRQESSSLMWCAILLNGSCVLLLAENLCLLARQLNLQSRTQLLGVDHGLLVVVADLRDHHLVHVVELLNLVAVHQLLVGDDDLPVLLHVGDGVVLHGDGLVGIQLLGHTLVGFIVSVDGLGRETSDNVGEVVYYLLLYHVWTIATGKLELRLEVRMSRRVLIGFGFLCCFFILHCGF